MIFRFFRPDYSFIISSQGWLVLNYTNINNKNDIIFYGNVPDEEMEKIKFKPLQLYPQAETNSALLEKIEEKEAQHLLYELCERDVIFTGAGISKAANIATQDDLMYDFGMDNIHKLVSLCTNKPEQLLQIFIKFTARLGLSRPTPAHQFVHRLVESNGCALITENIDLLHQKTGSKVIFAFFPEADEIPTPDTTFLLGVGSPSRKDLIQKWHKNGTRIIAVSLNPPNLSGVRFEWVQADVQKFCHTPNPEVFKRGN